VVLTVRPVGRAPVVLKRNTTSGKVLSPAKGKGGYLLVRLSKNGKYKSTSVHRLVVTAFIRKLEDGEQVNHLNFNIADNRLENLEICSAQENMIHYYKNNKDGKIKLSFDDIKKIIDLVKQKGMRQVVVAKMFGIHQADVSNYVKHKRRIYQY